MCMFRDLTASEIECRVGQVFKNGLALLLYKDARVDMAILDETVGQARWQREHYEVKGNLYCRVGIKIDNEWIWKADCGTESNTEAQKGESSDSFKRACVNWGIGRELYTAPFIWVSASDYSLNDKGKPADSFSVVSIEIKDKTIVSLSIKNDKSGKVVYTYGKKQPPKQNVTPPAASAPVPSGVPFPEAEGFNAAASQKKDPAELVKPKEDLAELRKWALAYKVETGNRAGMTLGDVRKMDKAAYKALVNNPPSIECAKAIQIINDWVSESQRAQG